MTGPPPHRRVVIFTSFFDYSLLRECFASGTGVASTEATTESIRWKILPRISVMMQTRGNRGRKGSMVGKWGYCLVKNSLAGTAIALKSLPSYFLRSSYRDQSTTVSQIKLLDEKAVRKRTSNKKIGYIKTLDGWRAIAITIVILAHARDSLTAYFGPNILFDTLSEQGLFGVRIFFALSGFLITLRIIEEVEDRGKLSLKGFYIRRFFRILPPLFLFCFFTAVLGILNILPVGMLEWISGPLFFTNLIDHKHWYVGHLWSLSVEEHFYLVWPAVFVLISLYKLPKIILLTVAGLGVWRIAVWKYELYSTSEVFWGRTDIQFDGLLWGCFFAIVYRYGNRQIVTRLGTPLLALLSALLVIGLIPLMAFDYKLSMLIYSIQAALIPVMILGTVSNPNSLIARSLENKIVKWIGRLSYSLYLWQQLFFVPYDSASSSLRFFQLWPINLIAVLLCAAASYYFIEKRFIRMGHRIAKPATGGR